MFTLGLALSLLLTNVWSDNNHGMVRQSATDTSSNNTIVVSLNPGQQLRGFYTSLTSGVIIYKFFGIRFGQAPTGDRRFAEPVAAPDWQGVTDALQFGHICWQTSAGSQEESEDCLFLNVYTPSMNESAPVMVWIHGGAYSFGASSRNDGSTLAAKGVVVVTVNYRLGAYGFLSTEDDVMPGNYGMLDQVLALKWVQKNIHAFGGDPGKVTIFGGSAGSSSVSLQVLSPLSKGLFHKAIMQSGSAISIWAVEMPAAKLRIKDYTRQVGAKIGCQDTDSRPFLTCLRKAEAHVLFNASFTLQHDLDIEIISSPRVENKFGFLPHYPQYILDNGLFSKVDTLRGFNFGELSSFILDFENDGLTREEFKQNFANVFSTLSLDNRSQEFIRNAVEKEFLGNLTNPLAIRASLITALTDTYFGASELVELNKYLAHGGEGFSHFVYELNYKPQSHLNPQSLGPDWWGTIHGSEISLVFAPDLVGDASLTPPDDVAVGNKIQTWWTNFAKFGNPTATRVIEDGVDVRWDQYTLANSNILKINVKSSQAPFSRPKSLALYKQALNFVTNGNFTGDFIPT